MAGNVLPRRLRASKAVLTTDNMALAAEQCEVSTRTLYRWMRDVDCLAAPHWWLLKPRHCPKQNDGGLGRDACVVLREVMNDSFTPISARLSAASIWLSGILQLHELGSRGAYRQ